jgi:hypothetical protein
MSLEGTSNPILAQSWDSSIKISDSLLIPNPRHDCNKWNEFELPE